MSHQGSCWKGRKAMVMQRPRVLEDLSGTTGRWLKDALDHLRIFFQTTMEGEFQVGKSAPSSLVVRSKQNVCICLSNEAWQEFTLQLSNRRPCESCAVNPTINPSITAPAALTTPTPHPTPPRYLLSCSWCRLSVAPRGHDAWWTATSGLIA